MRRSFSFLLLALLVILAAFVVGGSSSPTSEQPILSKHDRYQHLLDAEGGHKEVTPRVVGGSAVPSTTTYPFFIEWADANCGASLIHDDIALSAAHCEDEGHPFNTQVFLLGLNTEAGIPRFVEQQVSHPLYNGGKQDYDFMLLKLDRSALVDEYDLPTGAELVRLNKNRNLPRVGDALTGMGFGKTDQEAETTSQVFNEVEIYYVDDATCLAQYTASDFVKELMFCAGVPGGGKDTCQGDSGGPIMHQNTNTQVGVVSFGVGCALPDFSGVNARVSVAMEWIEDTICELSDMPPERCKPKVNGNGNGNGNNNNNPTSAPTESPPDILPSGGVGQITVHVKYDNYPPETAWDLTYLSMDDGDPLQLFLHTFGQDEALKQQTVQTTFSYLPAGTYSLRLGDQPGDGICCDFGNGLVWVTDDLTGATIWSEGAYGSYVEVLMQMNAAGVVVVTRKDYDYDNSWEAFEAVNHPPTYDVQWPGGYPNAARYALEINVKFDSFPEEVDWYFYSNPSGNSWTQLKHFDGTTEGVHNTLVSTEFNNLAGLTWYRLRIVDREGDGICCTYRRGWLSITAPIITTRLKGLVFGNNGEFGRSLEVYVWIDSEGFVSQVAYADPLQTSRSGGGGGVRKNVPGERRALDEDELRHRSLSTFTDLPKEGLKPLY